METDAPLEVRMSSAQSRISGTLSLLAAVVGLAYALHLTWICDDAWISFRYARNLIEGHGLTFNPGEYVEGFTNLLWTLILALGLQAGMDPVTIITVLSMGFGALAWWFLIRLHRRLAGEVGLFPVTLWALAGNYTWACFMSSGLETPLLIALCLGGTLFALQAGDQTTEPVLGGRNTLLAGAFFALAVLARPDAVVMTFGAWLVLLRRAVRERSGWNGAFRFLVPLLVLLIPVEIWRLSYYGLPFPNTFYAKTGGSGYLPLGLNYVTQFIGRYRLWPFLALLVIGPVLRSWSPPQVDGREGPSPAVSEGDDRASLGLLCILHLAYVITVGGDFMEGRFLVVILPLLFLLIEAGIRRDLPWIALRGMLLFALIGVSCCSPATIGPGRIDNGIADERTWQPMVQVWLLEGELFRSNLPPDTLFATENIGGFGWTGRFPIVDLHGLTDPRIARSKNPVRGRIGHEKIASFEYLVERKVEVIRTHLLPTTIQPIWKSVFHRFFVIRDERGVAEGVKTAGAAFDNLRTGNFSDL